MPRAYRPRIATSQRASAAARALGATSWHLYRPGPFRSGPPSVSLWWDRDREDMTLAEAEQRARQGSGRGLVPPDVDKSTETRDADAMNHPTPNGRHAFVPQTSSLVCADCGMTRGSVRHSRLGSTRHITAKENPTMSAAFTPVPKPSQRQARANRDATKATTPRQRAKNTRALEASARLAAGTSPSLTIPAEQAIDGVAFTVSADPGHVCPKCGFSAKNATGLSSHERKHRKPDLAAEMAATSSDPDAALANLRANEEIARETGRKMRASAEAIRVEAAKGRAKRAEARAEALTRPEAKVYAEGITKALQPKPEPRHRVASGVTLRDLLAAGIIDAGRTLTATYKGRTFTAILLADGKVEWNGTEYASPSLAAGMVRMSVIGAPKGYAFPQTNGWTFWRMTDDNGDLQPLDAWRTGATKTVVSESVPQAPRLGDPEKVAKVARAKAIVEAADRLPGPEAAKAMGTDEVQAALETVAAASLGAPRSAAEVDADLPF